MLFHHHDDSGAPYDKSCAACIELVRSIPSVGEPAKIKAIEPLDLAINVKSLLFCKAERDELLAVLEDVRINKVTYLVYQDEESLPEAVVIPWDLYTALYGNKEDQPPEDLIDPAKVEWSVTRQAIPGGEWSVKLIYNGGEAYLFADSDEYNSVLQAKAGLLKRLVDMKR